MNYYVGVDVGTSGCKAVAFDESGRQISSGYREYDIISPETGWAELDPNEVMDKCLRVIAQAAAEAPDGKVRGLGISSQGEAFTAIDKDGKVLCNAIVSFDTRAADYAAKFPAQFGPERLYQITGHTAHPLFSIFKMLWFRDNQPGLWQRAEKFLCMEDLLQYRLGLDPAISWPLAGRTMLFDVRKHAWNDEILDAVRLTPAKLARPLRSGSLAGNLSPEITARLGLAPDAFVVTGGHDQPCGALGAGVTAPGLAMYATGTVECFCLAFADPVFTDELQKSNLCTYDHTVEGMYATLAFNLTGGNILKWFRDNFAQPEIAEAQKLGLDPYAQTMHTVFRWLHSQAALDEGQGAAWVFPADAFPGEPPPGPDDSDAIVPTLSQVWGPLIHACWADHLDVIGHYGGPNDDPPHYDWIPSGTGFDRQRFTAVWQDVAEFIARSSAGTLTG